MAVVEILQPRILTPLDIITTNISRFSMETL